MKWEKIEKKIYELLGVNVFRKAILFTYEKLWRRFGGIPAYHLQNLTIQEIIQYKKLNAKGFGYAHFFVIIAVLFCYLENVITFDNLAFQILLNGYCIMTQRYNTIRINEIVEKYQKIEKKRTLLQEEKENLEASKTKEKTSTYRRIPCIENTYEPQIVEEFNLVPTRRLIKRGDE